MVNEKDIALIDDYLDGRFSQEEKTLLEKRFETEPDLAELLKLVKFTRESIRMSGQREQVKGIYTEFLQEKSSNQIKDLLQKVMTKNGIRKYMQELWHFTLRGEPFKNQYFDFVVK